MKLESLEKKMRTFYSIYKDNALSYRSVFNDHGSTSVFNDHGSTKKLLAEINLK